MRAAPYGSWPSPVRAEALAEQSVVLSDPTVTAGQVAWVERRAADGGRQVVVVLAGSAPRDVLPAPFSARSRVHEYGGRCYLRAAGRWFFTNDADQRVWSLAEDGRAAPVSPEPATPGAERYADLAAGVGDAWLYAVRERHGPGGVVNDLVRLDPDGATPPEVVAAGHDCYAAPRPSPDGTELAYLCWDLPHMPWDSSRLVVATLDGQGRATGESVLAGGPGVSVSQPRYSPAGELHFCSDRSGYWLVCARDGRPLVADDADYCGPDWVFGQSSFAFSASGRVFGVRHGVGGRHLGELRDGRFEPLALETELTEFAGLAVDEESLVVLAGAAAFPTALVRIDPDRGRVAPIRVSRSIPPGLAVSAPETLTFPGGSGAPTHAYYYPPSSQDAEGAPGTSPPLVVQGHGGPTAQASTAFDLHKQFFTSRGFAVVDVDYGGSSGYGRAYRERLEGRWGDLDVADCLAAVRHLSERGLADPGRVVIRGASAGGYTALQALVTSDAFAAGASLSGLADLRAFATDTHKFESGYLERLVGPWPAAEARYLERSPLLHADAITCPVVFFQGLDDPVVPAAQTEQMVAALDRSGRPVCYVPIAGEGHGFRRAESIAFVARAELSFYGIVLGFEPDEAVPLEIAHADALGGG